MSDKSTVVDSTDVNQAMEEAYINYVSERKNMVSHCHSCGSVDIDDEAMFKAGWQAHEEHVKKETDKIIKEMKSRAKLFSDVSNGRN